MLLTISLSAINFKDGKKIFPYHLWFGGGVGSMWSDTSDFSTLNASVNFSMAHHIIKLRAIGSITDSSTPYGESAGDIGLLYGYRQSFGNINISYLAGAGITKGTYQGARIIDNTLPYEKYEMKDYNTLCIPIEVQIDLNALRPLGLNMSLFGDLNSEKSFVGLSLNLLLGRLP